MILKPYIANYSYVWLSYPTTNYDDKSKNKYFAAHSNILLVIVKICDLI